ncbi:MAG: ParB/RepB/Spo0J family partition protein [Pseudomonadota bacterium]
MAKPKAKPTKGLGRGLSALMADIDARPASSKNQGIKTQATPSELHVPIETVYPNPDQPRRSFVQDELDELASSIKERGVIQPLIVRSDPTHEGGYQIVAGERRWRASQIAGVHEVPVLVRAMDDLEVLEVAIIENIQRSDLNPVDEATGYRQLMERFGHTQEQLSKALGKSRSHIANLIRLLGLPREVLDYLRDGQLTMGHARALVPSQNAVALAQAIIQRNLSVREVEALMKARETVQISKAGPKQPKAQDTIELENNLKAELGLKVAIDDKGGSGTVKLSYKSLDELDDLIKRLMGND